MFSIQPKILNFGDMLEKRLFRIPRYQRAYSWRRAERMDMFKDIRKLKEKPRASHFMATVVGLCRDTIAIGTDDYEVIDIVDGQQRLTTLVILLKVIEQELELEVIAEEMALSLADADGAVQTSATREKRRLQELLVKQDEVTEILLQTNHDRSQYFADFLREGKTPPASEAQTLADRELLTAIHECRSFVQREGNPTELLRLLKNQLWFIFHQTHDVESVYTVFEVLNDRGLEVSWLAKLKSRLMGVVAETALGNRAERINELHRIWGAFYATVGLREGVDTEALIFAGTLSSEKQVSKILSEGDAVERLMSQVETNVAKTIETSNWLLKVVNAVNRLQEEMRQPVTKIRHARLLAIAIILRDFPDEEEQKLLDQWEKTTFRIFGLCRKDARTGVGDFVRLARDIYKEDLSPDCISQEIREIGAGYTIDEACDNLWNTDCYTKWKDELRYLLYRYEEHLAEQRGESLPILQWNQIWSESVVNSIEHILPQSKGSEHSWGKGIFVHRLGNLLLLPPSINSELGGKDPKAKKDAYHGTRLHLAEDVARTICAHDGWGEPEIVERENEIIGWVLGQYDC